MEHCILYIYSFALLLSFIDNQVVDIAWLIKKFHVKQWVLLRKYVGVFFFFCLDTKEEETRRKNQGWTSPGLLRKGRSGAVKPNSLRFTTLRQGFPTPPVHSSAQAPPPRPVFISNGFFIRQGASLLAFCSWLRLAFGFGFHYMTSEVRFVYIKFCLKMA